MIILAILVVWIDVIITNEHILQENESCFESGNAELEGRKVVKEHFWPEKLYVKL